MKMHKTKSKRENLLTSRFRMILLSLILACPLFCSAQDVAANSAKEQELVEISGKVTDKETGEPIIGVSIVVKGTFNGTVTDENGEFKLKTKSKFPLTLVASFVGYNGTEFEVSSKDAAVNIALASNAAVSEVVITSRRRQEAAQEVPIPISIITGRIVEDAVAFNVNRVKELVPTVQLYSSNPRNTTLNIRGLGSTFGLTNDGLDPGVGFYVDGVYYARPAVTTLDFLDVERIEVLRGPQGTLFGKNTTAGAFNITTRAPQFTLGGMFETSYGNYGFVQAKASVTGPIIKKWLAGRISFSGTQRDGNVYNTVTEKYVNDINNLGVKGQLLFTPTEKVNVTVAGEYTRQRPNGYAQVFAGAVQTKRSNHRQFETIIADLNYDLPSRDPFDRTIDHNTPWNSGNDIAGASVNVDAKIGPGTLTSTTAWRYWWWDPSNDRDFLGLNALSLSQAPSVHNQYSQEVRYAGDFSKRLSGVVGVYALYQDLKTNPVHTEAVGPDQWRFLQPSANDTLWETPGLLDGYGIKTTSRLKSFTGALFGQIDWNIIGGLHFLPGIRLNYDTKNVDYERTTFGGLDTDDAALIAIQKSVYNNQAFTTSAREFNPSGQVTLSYIVSKKINAFATYSLSYKPVGVNLGGLPNIPAGQPGAGTPDLSLAEINPELVNHFEAGAKTNPTQNFTLNLVGHYSNIKDYQTNVQSPQLGVNRGYIANAEEVRVFGIELDANVKFNEYVSLYGAFAFTDGEYVEFKNAPLPLEETGLRVDVDGTPTQVAFKDVSGGDLPGISKYAFSLGGEVSSKPVKFLGQEGKFFLALETFYRSSFSSSPSPSEFLNVDGYGLLNARLGYKSPKGVSLFFWGRNLTNKDYFEFLLPGAGSAGHYAAVLGDPLTFGGTLRYAF